MKKPKSKKKSKRSGTPNVYQNRAALKAKKTIAKRNKRLRTDEAFLLEFAARQEKYLKQFA